MIKIINKKQLICKSNNIGDPILFIPHHDLGLYNGGVLEFNYLGTNYNNDPEINSNRNLIYTKVNGWFKNLVGFINIPETVTSNTTSTLKIYLTSDKSIDFITSTNNDNRYFNKLYNNQNIILFLQLIII